MSDNLQKLGAIAFALVAISVSGTAIHNALSPEDRILIPSLGDEHLLSGQVSAGDIPINDFTAAETASGVTLPKDAHNFFTCTAGGAVGVGVHDLGSVRAWVYEFTGTEPPFSGDFWISPGELAVNPQYASINTLLTYKEGRRYYSMSEKDLYVECGNGLSLNEYCGDNICQNNENVHSCVNDCNICGDGVVFGGEACDDGDTANNNGCNNECDIEPFYQCNGSPSTCSRIVPVLPGGTSSSPGPGPGAGPISSSGSSAAGGTGGAGGAGGNGPGGPGPGPISSSGSSAAGGTGGAGGAGGAGGNGPGGPGGAGGPGGPGPGPGGPGPGPSNSHTECNTVYNQCKVVQGPGSDECVADSDCGGVISLASASIDEGNITLKYSKYFNTCAHIYTVSGNGARKFNQGINFICDVGADRVSQANQSQFNDELYVGDTIQICHGNNGNICSNSVTITGPISAGNGNLYVTKDSAPLRNRQLLGGALGETVLRLQFHAAGEGIDVTNIRLINSIVINSIDHLELYTDGTSTPFAVATVDGCAGGGGNTFCANMQSRQLVIPAGQDIDVLVRPRMKSDVEGGTSNETVEIGLISIDARGGASSNNLVQNNGDSTENGEVFIGTSVPGANGNYLKGNGNITVHSKITYITNANPDANGTSVPTGVSEIGQFKFTAAAHNNSNNGNNAVVFDGFIFNVNATNVAITASSFKLYNKSDQTKTLDCQAHYLGGEPFTAANISGSFSVRCAGIGSSIVDSEVGAGTNTTFVLQADIVNPNIASSVGGVSVLQVSLQNFDQAGPNLDIGFGFNASHVRWLDEDASTNEAFHWIEYPETVVRSTSYNS